MDREGRHPPWPRLPWGARLAQKPTAETQAVPESGSTCSFVSAPDHEYAVVAVACPLFVVIVVVVVVEVIELA